jgi:hypothetical protein
MNAIILGMRAVEEAELLERSMRVRVSVHESLQSVRVCI